MSDDTVLIPCGAAGIDALDRELFNRPNLPAVAEGLWTSSCYWLYARAVTMLFVLMLFFICEFNGKELGNMA